MWGGGGKLPSDQPTPSYIQIDTLKTMNLHLLVTHLPQTRAPGFVYNLSFPISPQLTAFETASHLLIKKKNVPSRRRRSTRR